MKIATIVGGWYFPAHLYEHVIKLNAPTDSTIDFFVMSHRNPLDANISTEMLSRKESNNQFDYILYSDIITYDKLRKLGYIVHECENAIGDYYFFNQWAELYDYSEYDYVLFMHDDNFMLSNFKNLLTDIFDNHTNLYKFNKSWVIDNSYQQIDYIANSPVGNRKTARGSFSIWSKQLLKSMNGQFSMNNINLTRTGLNTTPYGHDDLAEWNHMGRNFQDHVEANGFMKTTYRLSDTYRISNYMIEAERGLIGQTNVLKSEFINNLNKINL